MKRLLRPLRIILPVLILASSVPAEAKLFEVWGSGLAGYGTGSGGDSDKDFYRWVSGGAVGAEVGVKILFIGAFIDYLHWFGGERSGELISFNLGGDWTIGLSKRLSLVLRAAFGYYYGILPEDATYEDDLGTFRQVDTRGIGVRGGAGLRYSFAKVFSIGITPEIGYHYFFGGADTPITENNSSGWDLNLLGYFRIGLGF
jgi:hypothetical protein